MKTKKPHWADATPYEIALKEIKQLNVDYAELEIERDGLKAEIEALHDHLAVVIGQREEMCGSKECCGVEMDIKVQTLKQALEGVLVIAGYTDMTDMELRGEMLQGNGAAKPILVARAALRGEV